MAGRWAEQQCAAVPDSLHDGLMLVVANLYWLPVAVQIEVPVHPLGLILRKIHESIEVRVQILVFVFVLVRKFPDFVV